MTDTKPSVLESQRGETPTQLFEIARTRSYKKKGRYKGALLGLLGVVIFLAIWEVAALTGLVDARFLPGPSSVFPGFFEILTFPDFWAAMGVTVWVWALGLVISFVAATVLGVIIGLSPFLRKATNTTTEFLRPIPSVALIPLAVLLFGVQQESALLLIIYASFWQIFIQVLYGVADIDQVAMSTALSYGFTKWQRIRDIVFPTMLPYLMTGVRLAAAVALILAVTAQLLIGTPGLGLEIARAQSSGLYVTMYALILSTGVLGVLINIGARYLERSLLSWHESVRSEKAE